MELVKELPEIFEEFAEQRQRSFLVMKEVKDKGIPVVGAYCTYFPQEIAMAMGAVTVGLCSTSDETIPIAEKDLPKNLCPMVKASYGFAVSDKCPFFYFSDVVVGETTCDGKKKMYELMKEFKNVYIMELPNSQREDSLELWTKEIIRFKEYLEKTFNVEITEEKVRHAVHVSNQGRIALKKFYEVMKNDPAPMNGSQLFGVLYGSQFKFDKEKEAKKKQRTVEVKEVRLSPNIDTNDLNTKMNNARKFISKGNKVKVTLRFRGREMAHMQQSKHILDDFAEKMKDVAVIEKPAKLEGRSLSMVLTEKR